MRVVEIKEDISEEIEVDLSAFEELLEYQPHLKRSLQRMMKQETPETIQFDVQKIRELENSYNFIKDYHNVPFGDSENPCGEVPLTPSEQVRPPPDSDSNFKFAHIRPGTKLRLLQPTGSIPYFRHFVDELKDVTRTYCPICGVEAPCEHLPSKTDNERPIVLEEDPLGFDEMDL